MEKQKVITLCNDTQNFVEKFYTYYVEEKIESTFTDWNARDVLGHILFWIDHCGNKIYHIKKGLQFEMVDAYKANNENYEKNKTVNIEKIFDNINNVIFNCINVIDIYTENELLDKTLPTGFNFEMWRYIVMDMYIHPIKHLLHYYLKTENHSEFIHTITISFDNFMKFSNENMNVYDFNEFFEDYNIKEVQFAKLKNFNKNNEIIEKIIERNIE